MIELPTPAEMAEIDARAAKLGTPFHVLMERAGYGVADAVAAQTTYGVRILVIAGPGNNGGDAFVAAEVLRNRGYHVALIDLSAGRGDGAAAKARAACKVDRADAAGDAVERAQIIVDGLLGGGLRRDVSGEFARIIERVNAAPAKVVSIDLSSGIDGASGAVRGSAVKADVTVTFQRRKPAHFLEPGRSHTGRLQVVDIGIRDGHVATQNCRTFANEPPLWEKVRPRLAAAGHKYSRGHAVVVSGPAHATGAARLAATAALRAGAGLSTVASPGDALLVNACHLTAVMLKRVDSAEALSALLSDTRLNAVCLGPGLPPGEETAAHVEAALGAPAAVVLDAGALTTFAGEPERLAAMCDGRTVLTPHEGEYARVFGGSGGSGNKLERARRAAETTGATVLLKGADTVIAAPDGRAAINHNAPPDLATAGSGDVLAGIVTAFLAQGVDAFEAAAMAAYLHGETGQRAGPALIAEDLLTHLQSARAAFDTLPTEAD